MALLFCDSMDAYPFALNGDNHQIFERKYTTNISAGGGFNENTSQVIYASDRPGGAGYTINTGTATNNRTQYKQLEIAGSQTGIMSFWIKFTVTLGTGNIIARLSDGQQEQVSIRGDGAGHITFSRNGTTLATSTNTMATNTWNHIEFKCKIDPTVGTYEVRVNGSSTGWIPAATGANTRTSANSTFNSFMFGTSNNGQQSYYSIVVSDTSGSFCNDFLGVTRVVSVRAAAAGNYAQWTPNGSANFVLAGKEFQDDDLTVNSSGTANQVDSFAAEDLPYSGTVFAVQHQFLARQTGGHTRTIAALQRTAGTDYAGTTKGVPGGWALILDPQSVDPSSAGQFTESSINSSEFGYKLVS